MNKFPLIIALLIILWVLISSCIWQKNQIFSTQLNSYF